ncbi:MAG TPA: DUF1508 domain-containing protein [Gemmataceae bacterium]|jgi:uncharacterized protein YegP (UPF0339 family)
MRKVVRVLLLSAVCLAVVGLGGPPFASGQAKKDKETKAAAGTVVFQVKKSEKDGKFRFSLRDSEGTLLALSSPSGYETKAECQKVIETIRNNVAKAKVEFVTAPAEDKKPTTEDKKKK